MKNRVREEPRKPPTIEERWYQIFSFGKYEPKEPEPLTQWQRDVLAKIQKFNGKVSEAAIAMGITPDRAHSIVATIREKGWKV